MQPLRDDSFAAERGSGPGSARRKLTRLLKHGVLMDVSVLTRFCKDNLPHATFQARRIVSAATQILSCAQEAYKKTGRIVNIVVTHPAPGVPAILNHITTPNVLLWSAACGLPTGNGGGAQLQQCRATSRACTSPSTSWPRTLTATWSALSRRSVAPALRSATRTTSP